MPPRVQREAEARPAASAGAADSEALTTQADDDSRLKYLGSTRDSRYTERSLLLRFHTIERGERRLLLLNLRKGYLKQGEWFGTKVYLSRAPAAAPTRTPPPTPPRKLPPHTASPLQRLS